LLLCIFQVSIPLDVVVVVHHMSVKVFVVNSVFFDGAEINHT